MLISQLDKYGKPLRALKCVKCKGKYIQPADWANHKAMHARQLVDKP